MRAGEGPTPFRGRRQSARVVDSRRYRALAGRTACVCAAERGSREEMGRYAIPVSSLRPREIDNVKGRSSTRAQCCWRALPILWVRVDGAKTARRNAPSSLATDGWGWKRCRSLFTNLHRSWSRRNCSASALKCGASYCVRFEQTERESQPVMGPPARAIRRHEHICGHVALEARNAVVDCPSIVVGDSLSLQGCRQRGAPLTRPRNGSRLLFWRRRFAGTTDRSTVAAVPTLLSTYVPG